jgi:hypothetical protein
MLLPENQWFALRLSLKLFHQGFASKVGLLGDFWGKRHFCPKNQFN